MHEQRPRGVNRLNVLPGQKQKIEGRARGADGVFSDFVGARLALPRYRRPFVSRDRGGRDSAFVSATLI
jgi:hypothetical protein